MDGPLADPAAMDEATFAAEVVAPIEGWLYPYAAQRTLGLLRLQEEAGVRGGLVEIGVFAGKYLAVMARSALRAGDPLLGIDTFQWTWPDTVRENLGRVPGAEALDLALWQRPSTDCLPEEITAAVGGRARFVSIDGSHERRDVLLDLRLAEQVLHRRGVVAVDDFMNPVAIGVNEAVHVYLAGEPVLAPFAFVLNKLFLCRRGQEAFYRAGLERQVEEDRHAAESERFRRAREAGRDRVEQRLWGHPVLIPGYA